ncbi:MAG: bifunctional transaldolase/phosoglucose isomerase [Acidobacteriaceae bacterium]
MANELTSTLPSDLQSKYDQAAQAWEKNGNTKKLWNRDASLWTNDDEGDWLGWLDIVERQQKDLDTFHSLTDEMKSAGFASALLLGMGGSSLCPEVLAITFGKQNGSPVLHILDSTDPAEIRDRQNAIDLAKTVFIVSSKSGSTLEPNILKQYFFEEVKKAVGADKVGQHFIAITDPGSKMERVAKADKFRHVFYGDKQIGGRYSALSNFGIVPAAIMGLDVKRLLADAQTAVEAAKNESVEANAGVKLGLILGAAANAGRDKITFFTSPEIYDLGAWFEQLIAESTGKQGKGITPVDREHIAEPSHYGNDRIFAYVRLEGDANADLDAQVEALEKAGQPVVRLHLKDKYGIAQEFFTWEIATAVAGSVIGINCFNQPDVEASKIEARRLTDEYEETGKLTERTPIFSSGDDGQGIKIIASKKYAAVLNKSAGDKPDFDALIKAHLDQIKPGDYFAVLAYLNMTEEHEDAIQYFRHEVRGAKKVATCLGFGPRFQHSTGQDYKGGPNTGVFIQITADHPQDLQVPDQKYTFGVVIAAQAAGDLTVLEQRDRRVIRVHLGADVKGNLKKLSDAVEKALVA